MKLIHGPILGQEAIVPKYGLGRVIAFDDQHEPPRYIEVAPYIREYSMRFAPENVTLIPIRIETDE